MGDRHNSKRRRPAFTLIELLVVVAILAILAAMLLPTLSRAKAASLRVVCINQVRQQYLAVSAYTENWDERIPFYIEGWDQYHTESRMMDDGALHISKTTSSGVNLKKWSDILLCPEGEGRWSWDPEANGLVTEFHTFRNGVTARVKVEFPEADIRKLRRTNGTSYITPGRMVVTHYALNGRHHVYKKANTYNIDGRDHVAPFADLANDKQPRVLGGASHPAETWLTGDGSWADIGLSHAVFRHLGTCVFSYIDGHADYLRPEDVDGVSLGADRFGSALVDPRLQYTK